MMYRLMTALSATILMIVLAASPAPAAIDIPRQTPTERLSGWEVAASRSATRAQDVPTRHKVRAGDSLASIAEKYDVPGGFERLHYVNRKKVDSADMIAVGTVLTIPSKPGKTIEYTPPAPPVQEVTSSTSAKPSSSSSSSPASSPSYSGPSSGVWYALAQCESGGNWSTNTGNGYYGGLQFSLTTWRSVGGTGYPHEHSAAEQIKRGQILQARSGWGQWPACSSKLGLR